MQVIFSEIKKKNAEVNGEENKPKQEKEKSGENPNDDGAISDSDDEKEKQWINGTLSISLVIATLE